MDINLKTGLNELDNFVNRLQLLVYQFTKKPDFGSWTQYADAVKINRSTFQNYKDGKRIPSPRHLIRICAFSKCSSEWLLYGHENTSKVAEKPASYGDILEFNHRLNYTKIFDIRGTQYTLKEFIEYATEILASDHDNADSLARNILSFIGPVRESQGKLPPQKDIKKKKSNAK